MRKVWDPRDPGFHGKQCGKDQKIVWLKRKRKRKRKEKKEKKEEKKKREKKEEKNRKGREKENNVVRTKNSAVV